MRSVVFKVEKSMRERQAEKKLSEMNITLDASRIRKSRNRSPIRIYHLTKVLNPESPSKLMANTTVSQTC